MATRAELLALRSELRALRPAGGGSRLVAIGAGKAQTASDHAAIVARVDVLESAFANVSLMRQEIAQGFQEIQQALVALGQRSSQSRRPGPYREPSPAAPTSPSPAEDASVESPNESPVEPRAARQKWGQVGVLSVTPRKTWQRFDPVVPRSLARKIPSNSNVATEGPDLNMHFSSVEPGIEPQERFDCARSGGYWQTASTLPPIPAGRHTARPSTPSTRMGGIVLQAERHADRQSCREQFQTEDKGPDGQPAGNQDPRC
ncbi:hypothetical protein Micbo1qcDRAFT_179778 [Microdochium bolleyi]|uniref:Uncharacterized protein n=1 Tax=Microdochium bolleyi TaxID=196109 RepID=A0A136INJ5_9PEZI|nr:hypothetical protein Micbo1qcDRAFT_179778 [Microdochium bolleyi]